MEIHNLERQVSLLEERLFFLNTKHYPILELEIKIDNLNRQNKFGKELETYVANLYLMKQDLRRDELEKQDIHSRLQDYRNLLLNLYRNYFASRS